MRRLFFCLLTAAALLAFAPGAALGAIAEVRNAQGNLVVAANGGSFASMQDGGWTLRFDSSSRSSRGVSLSGVTIAGGLVYAERIFVPAHGLAGAYVHGLTVNGKAVAARPNTLSPAACQ